MCPHSLHVHSHLLYYLIVYTRSLYTSKLLVAVIKDWRQGMRLQSLSMPWCIWTSWMLFVLASSLCCMWMLLYTHYWWLHVLVELQNDSLQSGCVLYRCKRISDRDWWWLAHMSQRVCVINFLDDKPFLLCSHAAAKIWGWGSKEGSQETWVG